MENNYEVAENSDNSYYTKVIRPLTRHNIYSYYIPLNGTISYYAFSLHVSLPGGLFR